MRTLPLSLSLFYTLMYCAITVSCRYVGCSNEKCVVGSPWLTPLGTRCRR